MQLVSVLLALSLLTSCAAGPVKGDAVILTTQEGAETAAGVILDSQSDGEDYTALSEEDMDFYLREVYTIPGEILDKGEFGAVIYTAGEVDAREIVVLTGLGSADSHTAAGALESYRQGRVGDFTGYAPQQAQVAERGLVMDGNIALLMICTDPAGAQKAMEEDLSHLVIRPYDPEEADEPYDWTRYFDEEGRRIFDPPGDHDMTLYDTLAIRAAWAAGDPSGLEEKDAAIYEACEAAFDQVITEDMIDYQKELALHDYLVSHSEYDKNALRGGVGREDCSNPYGPLVKGYGICLGYATSFQLLMDLAGIECITVVGASSGSSQDHAWNMVKLDEDWYCVDTTWDDPVGLPPGITYIEYEYFNVTSQYMVDTDHQWDYENVPWATATWYRPGNSRLDWR